MGGWIEIDRSIGADANMVHKLACFLEIASTFSVCVDKYTYTYLSTYIHACVCVCVCVFLIVCL